MVSGSAVNGERSESAGREAPLTAGSETKIIERRGGRGRATARRAVRRRGLRIECCPFSYYALCVVGETIRGKPVTEEQIQAWADEAEKGFPVERLRKRGRRPVGDGPGEMVAVRMDEALLTQLTARAEREHVSRSEAIRAAVKAWIDAP